MACPLRHYLGYFYWFAAFAGAIAVLFGMIRDFASFQRVAATRAVRRLQRRKGNGKIERGIDFGEKAKSRARRRVAVVASSHVDV